MTVAAPDAQKSSDRIEHPGRDARSPPQMPARGWLQIAKRVFGKISSNRLPTEAAAVTFYVILSLFPALAALVSLYGLIADPRTIQATISGLATIIPGGGMQIIGDQLHALTSNRSKALGWSALIGLLTALWSANSGVKGIFDALNVVYGEAEKRSFIRRTGITLFFTVCGILFLIAALGGVIALPIAIQFLGLQTPLKIVIDLLRWPALLIVITVLLGILYRYGPSRLLARWRWVTWGGGFAAIAWVITSAAFSFYVSHFGNYNKTYGSLGAAIGFMTWIWLSTIVVLIGGELNAELEHQTEEDTTVGQEKPPGRRDATMANEVA